MAVDLRDKIETKVVGIPIGQHTLQITMATNLDALLEYVEHEDDIPFWAELWPSSVVLAQYLAGLDGLAGLRILELGAGLGVAGLGAKLAGADLVQSDFIPLALEFCLQNAMANGLAGIQYKLIDWRQFDAADKYNVLIGADILYERTVHEPLLQVLMDGLAAGGKVFLADPGREAAREFMDLAGGQGFIIEKLQQEICWQERNYKVDIYCLTMGNRGQINEGGHNRK